MYESSTRETWDQLAPGYDARRAPDPVYRSCIRQTVAAARPEGVVLDAGCGTGMTTRLMLHCERIEALDFSARSLQVLQQKVGPRANLDLVHGDLLELPFADAEFDCVVCANALNCLTPENHPRAAAELLRVLRPGGRYAVSAHHYSRYKARRRWVKQGRPGEPDIDYIYRFSAGELAALFPGATLRAAGFYALPGRAQDPISRWLGRALVPLKVGHILIAYGQKPAH